MAKKKYQCMKWKRKKKFNPLTDDIIWQEFHHDLRGIDIYKNGKRVAKYQVWNTYRESQPDLQLIMDRIHNSFEFKVNDEYYHFIDSKRKSKMDFSGLNHLIYR